MHADDHAPSTADLLDQAEIWIDGSGDEHEIAEMEPRYCANVVRFLARLAPQLAAADSLAMLSVRMPGAHTQAFDEVACDMADGFQRKATDPIGWLNDTPLMVALRARAGEVAW